MNPFGVFGQIPLAIVDVETTGARPGYDRIIDIAIIRIENGVVVERYSTLVDPERRLVASISSLTGINPNELIGAPTFAQIAQDVHGLLKGAYVVAHNARFDYAFLKQELNRQGIKFSAKCLCTVKLSRYLYPQQRRHDLSTLIDIHGFSCEARHRALPDAAVLGDFLQLCHVQHGEEKCKEALDHVLKKSAVPAKLNKTVLDNLPHAPGVYKFFGESGEILYIGKSVNIRNRVLSHFASDHQTTKQLKMVSEIADIKIERTTGELGALLLESYLIKKEGPIYNRMARKQKRIVVIAESVNKHGYKTIELKDTRPEDVEDTRAVLRICKSVRQAKKVLEHYAEEYKLCPALLGIENPKHPCFWSQLGKCDGACKQKEGELEYNMRFDQAFGTYRIQRWPYGGPVLYTEYDKEDSTSGIGFVVDDWRLVASYRFDEIGARQFLPEQYVFDNDSYRILVSFLLKAKSRELKRLGKPEFKQLLQQLDMQRDTEAVEY